jgi:membrane protein YdbS with pleckstrin-like domain
MATEARAAPLERFLLRTETTVFAVRRHPAALAPSAMLLLLYWLGAIIVIATTGSVPFVRLIAICFMFFSLCWFAWQVADWQVERFLVTNRRVLLVSGLLTRNVAIMPLIKVTDLTYQQSPAGRLLHYGSFIIESAGQHQALSRIDYLPQPNKRYQQVSALLFGTMVDVDPEDGLGAQITEPVPYVPAP